MPELVKHTLYMAIWLGLCAFIIRSLLKLTDKKLNEFCDAHAELVKVLKKMYHQVIKRG